MASLLFVTHPEVVVDPAVPIERWQLSHKGIERIRAFSRSSVCADVRTVWASGETKAIEAAGILAGALGLGIQVSKDLGENDRSATGFLPPAEFEAVADAFFANPNTSIHGWERAIDAQTRVRQAVLRILAQHGEGDVAVVSHGAVGTLLFCALSGHAISRTFDQPSQGHWWKAVLPSLRPTSGWAPIAPR
ncbi:histidine phosphatase family protein [Aureimonas phyllosphaerae]|uniref:Broad specificity phosphatase PhoE n=1 Tax=Aureimonas phyllosphaerae TaxID=1166078 RepID=A0A7W6FWC1_9HYPH|nr:histidine phosphatase family protein [Aureimonas phyllosphaerae]MBB3938174.1 broad specificity phosphatase PhoE [Aureimonas phyllosphaerae]MBB3962200.1 broad specificity phosphatase PhoE [Aureimonas phyllosphaerae]SFF57460.1 Broad specificity phosphatase PhoE [Aureimonas phyllosphaerae]